MTDNWDFYFRTIDGKDASIYLDLGMSASAPLATHGYLGTVSISMRQPKENGLSSQEEYPELIALEDHVTPSIAAGGDAVYVGRHTGAGYRVFYFYTSDPVRFSTAAAAAMERYRHYPADIATRPDADWSTYRTLLFPSPEDMQRILNRRVRDSLAGHGDRLSEPRPVDHMVYFPHADAAEAFIAKVRGQGFAILSSRREDDGTHAVNFVRTDAPSDMDDVVIPLDRLARSLGGHYDGWGCEVVK